MQLHATAGTVIGQDCGNCILRNFVASEKFWLHIVPEIGTSSTRYRQKWRPQEKNLGDANGVCASTRWQPCDVASATCCGTSASTTPMFMEVDKIQKKNGRTIVNRAGREVPAITRLLQKDGHVERIPRARRRVRKRPSILRQHWVHRGPQKISHLHLHYQINRRHRHRHPMRMCKNW